MSTATLDNVESLPTEQAGGHNAELGAASIRPMPIEWIAFAATILALVALALVRVGLTDTPYHLATARLAHDSGHWPTTNTFSHTFPDYPLFQQYPVYQELLYRVHEWFGWNGLSVLHFCAYSAIFLLWIAWGGGLRWAVVLSLPTMLLLLGLRERMVLRPDILTMAYFVLTLLAIDRLRRGQIWAAWMLPLIALLWVNSHQMFWLGLAIQGAFLAHLAIVRSFGGRFGVAVDDRTVPLLPISIALGLSVVCSLLSPIGPRVWEVPLHTTGSLFFHREHVMEFRPFYESPQALWLVAVSLILAAIIFFLGRKRWQPFEWFVWALGAAMAAGAIRGVPFLVALSVGLFARELKRRQGALAAETIAGGSSANPSSKVPLFFPRAVAVVVALALAAEVYWFRWIEPSRILGGSQFGLGRTLGDWPDEAMAFLKRNPPPGRMINLGWYIGNPIVLELFPKHSVFVDPRFEAYPREFLIDAIHSETEPIVLDRFIDRYEPLWIVGEVRIQGVRHQLARLLSLGDWELVYFDAICAVVVRKRPETLLYRKEHRIDIDRFDPPGLLKREPDLLALQQIRIASFLADMGDAKRARLWLAQIPKEAQQVFSVSHSIRELLADHPELKRN